MSWDVAIIGGGVVGTAIARELAGYQLRCVLLEAADDVGTGTSKANTAILHTGFDAAPGTLESRLVARGSLAAARVRAARPGSPSSRPGPCSWPGRRSRRPAWTRSLRSRGRTGTPAVRSVLGIRRLRTGAEPRTGRGRRALDPRRVGHRPVVGLARVRDRGGAGGRRPAARDAGHRGVGAGRRRRVRAGRGPRAQRRSAAGSRSTRRGWRATRWTGCSAATASRSSRARAS